MNFYPINRELHLIDIENELGASRITAIEVARFRTFYLEANKVPNDAHVIVATSGSHNLLEAAFGWPGARMVWLPGHDGADRALLELVKKENVAHRFDRVVIASGDSIFAETAESLQNLGVKVKVFARALFVSLNLRESCQDIELFSAKDFSLAA